MADIEREKKSSLVTDVLQKTGCLDKDEVWQSERENFQSTINEIIRQTEEAKVRNLLVFCLLNIKKLKTRGKKS